nr:MAG TPA: hypothetical protein [Caudoviricetes sp.]
MTNSIQTFNFENQSVRVEFKDGEPLFCLTDIATILEISNANSNRFNLDEAGVHKMYISYPSGAKQVTFINEPNLYRVIFRSNKAEAVKFQNWVFDEVLPSIHKTGSYATDKLSTKEERKPLVKAVNMLVDKSNLNYDEAWHLVHQYFNIKSVNELKSYQIKAAIAYIHGLIVANAQKTNQKQKVDDEFLFDTLAHAAEYLKEYANTIYVLSNLRFTSDKLATNMTKFVGECFTDMVKLSQDMDLRNQAGRPMFEERRINFYHGAALTW